MPRINKVSEEIMTCSECKKDHLRKTFRIEKDFFCVDCATQQVFGKVTDLLKGYVLKFHNDVAYEKLIRLASNILVNGIGSTRARARKAVQKTLFDIRKLTDTRYVILCSAGKEYVDNLRSMNPVPKTLNIDPKDPFESICYHVQQALNNGLPYYDAAEFIWGIRGVHDNITAMMYENEVIVTCPQGQRTLRLQL